MKRFVCIVALAAASAAAAQTTTPQYLPKTGGTMTGPLVAPITDSGGQVYNAKTYGAKGNGNFSDFKMTAGSNVVTLVDTSAGYTFAPTDVGKLISLPKVDSDGATLYTTITGYTSSTQVTVAATATNSFDGTGTFQNQAVWATDDLAALNTAISTAIALNAGSGANRIGGAQLYLPCGIYGLSGQLSIPGIVRIEAAAPYCVNLMYMGTTVIDAAVETVYGGGGNWLRGNYYLTNTNHPEVGGCTGTACSPAISRYIQGGMSDVSIYGNKYSKYALSMLAPTQYVLNNVFMYDGSAGCLYTLNGVQNQYSFVNCSRDMYYGHNAPVNGLYFDGTGTGQGTIPTYVQSPGIAYITGTAYTMNYVASMTFENAQSTQNHQNLNLLATSGQITFTGSLFEGGAAGQIADVIAGNTNLFLNCDLTGAAGITLSGPNNVFKNSLISGGQTLTISGANNAFEHTTWSTSLTIVDNAKNTSYKNLWNYNTTSAQLNYPMTQDASPNYTGVSDPVVTVKGAWYLLAANTNYVVASTPLNPGSAWKAIFIGNWTYAATATAMPPYVELTDTSNTVTFLGQTLTFSVSAGGVFQVKSTTGSGSGLGFSGTVMIVPRYVTAGTGGTESMQLAGDLKLPQVTVAGATIAGSSAAPIVSWAGTWNTTGKPTFFKLNVTDTASDASSLLFDYQVGGASQLSLRKDGVLMFGDATNAIYNAGNGQLIFGAASNPTLAINNSYPGNTSLSMSSVGLIGWSHVAGPMNSIDVALSRTNAGQVKVSAYNSSGPIATGGSLVTNPCTVANLPVGVDGARAFVTDSTLPLNGTNLGAAVVGGGSNHVPVYYDGGSSSWKIGG